MFDYGAFKSHSGLILPWKVDFDDLTETDLDSLAHIVRHKFCFSDVIGIPRGGLRLAASLRRFSQPGYPTLIVDDVLTTGNSLEEWRGPVPGPVVGVVILARGHCPNWVWPILRVEEWAQTRGTGVG